MTIKIVGKFVIYHRIFSIIFAHFRIFLEEKYITKYLTSGNLYVILDKSRKIFISFVTEYKAFFYENRNNMAPFVFNQPRNLLSQGKRYKSQ